MMIPSEKLPSRSAEGIPFRLLSGLLFSVCFVALLMMPFVVWRRGTPVALLHWLVVLPGLLWGIRRSWNSAMQKTTASNLDQWPFASRRVATVYSVINLLIALFALQLYR
jgi:hypothetical protein